MNVHQEFQLVRDCTATLIPAGEEAVLRKGQVVVVTQALGGTVTVRVPMGLYRLARKDLDALGEGAVEALEIKEEASKKNLQGQDVEGEKGAQQEQPFSEQIVWEALKNCYDPEIPVNIVDLGLIYDLRIEPIHKDVEESSGSFNVHIKMTLTARGCGMGPAIAADAKEKIEQLPRVKEATVDIVWDPAWTPHMISEEGKKRLGLA